MLKDQCQNNSNNSHPDLGLNYLYLVSILPYFYKVCLLNLNLILFLRENLASPLNFKCIML